MSSEHIRFYCGVNERTWNYHMVEPGPYACVSPVYGRTERTHSVNRVFIPTTTHVLQDSGAFSDGPMQRLSFAEALARQIYHADRYAYAQQITYRASYDLLIDERWMHGERHKMRWNVTDAELASTISIEAARYLTQHRQKEKLVLSAQGTTPQQYFSCVQELVPLLDEGDVLGFGGWCILGKMPSLLPIFAQTMALCIPYLAHKGVRTVHIWGVCYPKALHILYDVCNTHTLHLSTDSAHPSLHPVFGHWGYGEWRDPTYRRPAILPTCKSGLHHLCVGCRGLERIRHVQATRTWLATFGKGKIDTP